MALFKTEQEAAAVIVKHLQGCKKYLAEREACYSRNDNHRYICNAVEKFVYKHQPDTLRSTDHFGYVVDYIHRVIKGSSCVDDWVENRVGTKTYAKMDIQVFRHQLVDKLIKDLTRRYLS